jgi:hypothetical protein
LRSAFDGSDSDDWTALRAETMDGFQFTPTYSIGDERFPTIWDPAQFGGRIPRSHVHAAVEQMFRDHDVVRFYYDPPDWKTEGESWALLYGEKVVIEWATYRTTQMHASLERFVTDLTTGRITHDGCPITKTHIDNARKSPKPGQKYLLAKPHGAYHQKIDAAMASVLAHEAAADCRAAGLDKEPDNEPVYVWG